MESRVTLDGVVDRVRSLCAGAPFAFVEAVGSEDFARQPVGRADGVFRVKARGGVAVGGTSYTEERTDYLDLEVIRSVGGDYPACRRALLRDATSLTAAVVRDGHVTSGAYAVPDEGRASSIVGDRGASFLTLRLTLPANYETTV